MSKIGQPATSSFIPPSVDSLILDYQSPNASPGFYPNEDPDSGGVGECPVLCAVYCVSRGLIQLCGVCIEQFLSESTVVNAESLCRAVLLS